MSNRTKTAKENASNSRWWKALATLAASCMILAVAPGCESDTENAAEDVGEAVEDAADDAGDAIKDATN